MYSRGSTGPGVHWRWTSLPHASLLSFQVSTARKQIQRQQHQMHSPRNGLHWQHLLTLMVPYLQSANEGSDGESHDFPNNPPLAISTLVSSATYCDSGSPNSPPRDSRPDFPHLQTVTAQCINVTLTWSPGKYQGESPIKQNSKNHFQKHHFLLEGQNKCTYNSA